MLGSNYLTSETAAQKITFPGQAHFAIPGHPRVCRDCWFWSPKKPTDKRGVCLKAIEMASSDRSRFPMIPRHATPCKHFTTEEPPDPRLGGGLAA